MTESIDFSTGYNQAPPANIEVEEGVIGGILIDPDAFSRVVDTLEPNAFYVKSHQTIYRACLALHVEQRPVDLFTVSAWLTDHNLLQDAGGKIKLAQLADRIVSAVNIDALADLVLQKHISRKLISSGNAIIKLGHDQTEAVEQRIDMAEQKIFALRNQSGGTSQIQSIEDAWIAEFPEIERRAESGELPGIATGFYDLDEMLGGGVSPGDLMVVAGRPSMGKSLFAHTLAYNIAKLHEAPALIFSLEMTKQQILFRFLSREAKLSTVAIRAGALNQRQWADLIEAGSAVSQVKLLLDDSPCPSIFEIRSKARQVTAQYGSPKLIVIDYLQLMVDGSDMRLVQRVGELTRQLKLLAKECNVAIILVSQLNRDVEGQNNKRPSLSHLRDSGRIEEDADIVLGIYRDAYYNPETVDTNVAEIIFLKQRNGPLGAVKLLFDGEYSQFLNLAK